MDFAMVIHIVALCTYTAGLGFALYYRFRDSGIDDLEDRKEYIHTLIEMYPEVSQQMLEEFKEHYSDCEFCNMNDNTFCEVGAEIITRWQAVIFNLPDI